MSNKREDNKAEKSGLSMETIWKAFCQAELSLIEKGIPKRERFFGESEDSVRIFDYPANADKDPSKTCAVKRPTKKACFDFFVPDFIQKTLGYSESVYNNIMRGNGRSNTKFFEQRLEEDALNIFYDYKDYLEQAILWHIKVFVCLRNNRDINISMSRNKNKVDIGISVGYVNKEIESGKEFERLAPVFLSEFLKIVKDSDAFLSDTRIQRTLFYGTIMESADPIEILTILLILSFLAGRTIEGETVFFKNIYNAIYEDGKLRVRPEKEVESSPIPGITCETIELAGKYWYENTKRQGHRFAKLIPNKDLLPLAGNLPIQVYDENKNVQPLMEVLNQTPGHLYLIGEGGIGKTTALYSIMQDVYDSEEKAFCQIPLYVELSRARNPDDFDIKKGIGISYFIRNTIRRQILEYLGERKDVEMQLVDILTKKSKIPEYVFLLDGLNEVSRDEIDGHAIIQMLMAEICYIMSNYSNVRVILTSRSNEAFGEIITPIYLSGISSDTIEKYLDAKKVPEKRILKAKENDQLVNLLKVPLFLILYAELEGDDEYLSRGEILHAFFTKRKKGQYSIQNRVYDANSVVKYAAGIDIVGTVTPEMFAFVLDFVLPEIAWDMVRNSRFQIERNRIQDIARRVLSEKTDTSVCGQYGKKCFDEYITDKEDTRSIARSIIKVFSKDFDDEDEKWENISKNLCVCFKSQLGILQTNDSHEYEFVHHHVRDYFAALYHINRLKLACYIYREGDASAARDCLNEWKDSPLLLNQLSFIGECLGEVHNCPVYDEKVEKWVYIVPDIENECERNLVKRSLDIYRNRFDGDDGYAVWNLFQILKMTRKDLSGEDFSNLDLSKCRANGYCLSNGDFACKLEGSKVNDSFFMPMDHVNSIDSAEYSPDGKYILTTEFEGMHSEKSKLKVKVWDSKTFQIIRSSQLDGAMWNPRASVHFSRPDGKNIIAVSCGHTIEIWDTETLLPIRKGISYRDRVKSAEYSPDGSRILVCYSEGDISIWDSKMNEVIDECITEEMPFGLWTASYSPKGTYILIRTTQTLEILDARSLSRISDGLLKKDNELTEENCDIYEHFFIPPDESTLHDVACSHNEKYVVSAYGNTVEIWKIGCFREGPWRILRINEPAYSVQYSPDDMHIVIRSKSGFYVWEISTSNQIRNISCEVESVQYSPKGRYILTTSRAGVKIWDAVTLQEVPGGELKGINTIIASVEASPDGRLMSVWGQWKTQPEWKDRAGIFMDLTRGHVLLITSPRNMKSMHFNSNGEYHDVRSEELVDLKTFRRVPSSGIFGVRRTGAVSANFSRDGKRIILIARDGFKVYKADNHKCLYSSENTLAFENNDSLMTVFFCANDRYIVTVTFDGLISILNANTYEEVRTMHIVWGMNAWQVDIRNLHKDSKISKEVRGYLKEYGAITD